MEQTVPIWELWAVGVGDGGGVSIKAWHIIKRTRRLRLHNVLDLPTKLSLEQKRPGCHSLFHINSLSELLLLLKRRLFAVARIKGSESKTSLRNPVKGGEKTQAPLCWEEECKSAVIAAEHVCQVL